MVGGGWVTRLVVLVSPGGVARPPARRWPLHKM